jgi:hypothetical protein
MYSIPNGCNFGAVAAADIDKTTMFNNNNNKQTNNNRMWRNAHILKH